MRKFKILTAAGMLLAAVATVTAVGTLKEPVQRYFTGKDVASPLSVYEAELEGLSESAAAALEIPDAWYIVDGSATDDGYAVEIQAQGVYLYGGRFALNFDTNKLKLAGPDSLAAFKLASGINTVAEVRPESQMVSSEGGYACLAWYCNGMDAVSAPQTVATLNFQFQNGYSAKDIDASSFRLMAVEEGDMGPFRSAASIEGQGTLSTIPYEYLTTMQSCGVAFAYDGSDKLPLEGHKVTFTCKNNLDEPVDGILTINGASYAADGTPVLLGDGEYLWEINCRGYGTQSGRLELTEDTAMELTFVNDSSLVRAAAAGLSIGYQAGDSKDHVTSSLTLTDYLEGSGVEVTWESSNPSIINGGLVSLPQEDGVKVTLTATLTRGDAKAEKTFDVYVCSQAELNPKTDDVTTPVDPEQPGDEPAAAPDTKPETKPAVKFTDLGACESWAGEAIAKLTAAGVINGTSETTFAPDADITRGEFLAMLMRMLEVTEVEAARDFADVPADSYYYSEIMQARALGITQGVDAESNRFAPDAAISRQEMVTMTIRAMEITDYLKLRGVRDDLSGFQDAKQVAEYALDSMQKAVGQELIQGDNEQLRPADNTTRAETAVFLERIFSARAA